MYSQYYFLSLFAVSIETAALAVQHNIYKLLIMYTDQHISKPVVTSNSRFKHTFFNLNYSPSFGNSQDSDFSFELEADQ